MLFTTTICDNNKKVGLFLPDNLFGRRNARSRVWAKELKKKEKKNIGLPFLDTQNRLEWNRSDHQYWEVFCRIVCYNRGWQNDPLTSTHRESPARAQSSRAAAAAARGGYHGNQARHVDTGLYPRAACPRHVNCVLGKKGTWFSTLSRPIFFPRVHQSGWGKEGLLCDPPGAQGLIVETVTSFGRRQTGPYITINNVNRQQVIYFDFYNFVVDLF